MPFLILFVLIPLAEVYAFINVGEEIGVFKTLLLCIITAVIGGSLVRIQGVSTLLKARKSFMAGTLPLGELFDGLCLVIAGALLLTPGFVTDTIGFALLVPAFRKFLRPLVAKYGKFNASMSVNGRTNTRPRDSSDDIIEGEYKDVSNNKERLDKGDKSL